MATLSASAPAHAGAPGRPHSAQLLETVLVAVLLGIAGYSALFVAPTEATMGVIQRIFYFHVPSWWSAFVAFAIVLVSNLAYLRGRNPKWDWLGVSAAEVGVAFVTVGLVTGPIWAHPVWGIWWTWDARLTSAFVLWVLYVSVSPAAQPDRGARAPRRDLRCLRNLRGGGYSAGLFFHLVFPHPASAAGHWRWRFARSDHGQGAFAVLGGDVGCVGLDGASALSRGSFAVGRRSPAAGSCPEHQ